ncbi:hypothetical protein [Kineococcus sp. SYSU DK003]|uniref:hypothetical protein n=1 Tax=Kineococcus sp. SYSU DK003 TaxID=3383124 RepID=UPI003D7D8078
MPDLVVLRLGRHDVSVDTQPGGSAEPAVSGGGGAAPGQPTVWTFLDFTAPDERAEHLAAVLSDALQPQTGWWADFVVGAEHVVVFAGRVFRYCIGDAVAREEAVAWGRRVGTPAHQLDWGD